jgi:hypothetical protein
MVDIRVMQETQEDSENVSHDGLISGEDSSAHKAQIFIYIAIYNKKLIQWEKGFRF